MSVALEGYGLLKLMGRNKGLEALSGALATRFSRTRRSESEPVA